MHDLNSSILKKNCEQAFKSDRKSLFIHIFQKARYLSNSIKLLYFWKEKKSFKYSITTTNPITTRTTHYTLSYWQINRKILTMKNKQEKSTKSEQNTRIYIVWEIHLGIEWRVLCVACVLHSAHSLCC